MLYSFRAGSDGPRKGILAMSAHEAKRRKYIGVGGDDVPSLGVLEGDILRLLWNAGEGRSSVQVYDLMNAFRKSESKEMQSPSTIAVTLSRMVEKGLLKVERRPGSAKGYYAPTRSRAEVVCSVMDDVSRQLTGQPLGYLLTRISGTGGATYRTDGPCPQDAAYAALIDAMRGLRDEDNQPEPCAPAE